jgi:hypothetical protein
VSPTWQNNLLLFFQDLRAANIRYVTFTPDMNGGLGGINEQMWVYALNSYQEYAESAQVNFQTGALQMLGAKVGVFRNGNSFLMDSNGNGSFDSSDRLVANFTGPGGYVGGSYPDVPVVGDWTGNGVVSVGIYRASTGTWYLDANNDGVYDAGDLTYSFGGLTGSGGLASCQATPSTCPDVPVVGDWMNTGKSCIGIFRQADSGCWISTAMALTRALRQMRSSRSEAFRATSGWSATG